MCYYRRDANDNVVDQVLFVSMMGVIGVGWCGIKTVNRLRLFSKADHCIYNIVVSHFHLVDYYNPRLLLT